ncbi:MAG: hypothetical protein CMQ16_05085 [Gammaproteobacteria bacterium]|nr:hypothetical protein [Gammaproteobacteria bacterium]
MTCLNLTICSTFIVWLPSETESDFENALDFLDGAQLDRVWCYQYFTVDGARTSSMPYVI